MNDQDAETARNLSIDFKRLRPEVADVKPVAAGGSAYVFRMRLADRSERALKIFRPDQFHRDKLLEGFLREAARLRRLDHPHIVKAFETNSASFPSCGGCDLPFYIMEWVPYGSLDQALRARPLSLSSIADILGQVLDALCYLHAMKPPLCHLDIKEANLLVSSPGSEALHIKLSDFGLAKEISRDPEITEVRGTFTYWPEEWQRRLKDEIPSNLNRCVILLRRDEIPVSVDLHMLAVTLFRLLGRLEGADSMEYRFRGLTLLAERMHWNRCTLTEKGEKYTCASAVVHALTKLERAFSLPPPLSDSGTLRNPVNSLTGLGVAARAIIDNPWFQRLRGIRQLGLAHLVYPGAAHTRFEHALGVFAQAVEYLRALFSNRNSPWFVVYFSDEETRALALTALLHDIGHFPFAHQVEDLVGWRGHEHLSHEILTGSIVDRYPELLRRFGGSTSLLDAIEKHWRVDRSLMVRLFAYCYRETLGGSPPVDIPRSWRVATEVVNGPIDADKLDYIRRDAHHCGVSYGLMTDPTRFLGALTVAFKDTRPRLAVTEKGRVDAEFIAVTRYAMYSEVYWHHTLRSFTTMVRRAFFEAASWEDERLTPEKLLPLSDDQALCELRRRAEKIGNTAVAELLSLISSRTAYRRLFTLRRDTDDRLYDRLMEIRLQLMAGKHWEVDRELCELAFGIKVAEAYELLWDVPNPGKDKLEDVQIAEIDGRIVADRPGPLWSSLAPNFAQWVRKIRLFIHPKYRPLAARWEDGQRVFRRELVKRLGL